MPKGKALAPAVVGVAGGLVAGYLIGNMTAPALPRIDASIPRPAPGASFAYTFSGFPPNTQLVGPVALNPLQTVNIGFTDATGKVTVGSTAPSTAGTYVAIAWDAPTGKYCAMYTLIVQ